MLSEYSDFKVGVVQFPGTNCERETHMAIKRSGMQSGDFFWTQDVSLLDSFDALIIPGGFSYEDRGRSGIIAAKLPVMKKIAELAKRGVPILGICNGAQVLVESGLVPGFSNDELACALTENERRLSDGTLLGQGYINNWCHVKFDENMQAGAFGNIQGLLRVPFAHAEGKFIIPDEVYNLMLEHKVPMFRYCDQNGKAASHYPDNPNGSCHNLAAIGNFKGNVLAIMPHPERVTAGDAIFKSLADYLLNKLSNKQNIDINKVEIEAEAEAEAEAEVKFPINLDSQINKVSKDEFLQKSDNCLNWLIQEKITDNQAQSVEMSIRQHGFDINVVRTQAIKIHYDKNIISEDELSQKLIAAGVCFNPNKADLVNSLPGGEKSKLNYEHYIVKSNTDVLGERMFKSCIKDWDIKGVKSIESQVIWSFSYAVDLSPNSISKDIVNKGYIHNRYSQDVMAVCG